MRREFLSHCLQFEQIPGAGGEIIVPMTVSQLIMADGEVCADHGCRMLVLMMIIDSITYLNPSSLQSDPQSYKHSITVTNYC